MTGGRSWVRSSTSGSWLIASPVRRPQPRLERRDGEQRVVAVARRRASASSASRDRRGAQQRVGAVRLHVEVGRDLVDVVEQDVVHRHVAAEQVLGPLDQARPSGNARLRRRRRSCRESVSITTSSISGHVEQRADDVVEQRPAAERPVVLARARARWCGASGRSATMRRSRGAHAARRSRSAGACRRAPRRRRRDRPAPAG